MNEFNDEQLDPTVDRLLQQAFAGRPAHTAGSASLSDVRTRARRHQRRRAGAVVGAAAVVGIGGVGVLSRRDDGAATASPADGGATSTTAAFANCWSPQQGDPATTIEVVDGTWPAELATTTTSTTVDDSTTVVDPTTTTLAPDGTATTSAVEATSTTIAEFSTTTALLDAAGVPATAPCQPTGQYRCLGNNGTDDQGYAYFEYCEPWTAGGLPYPTTTTVPAGFVVIVDASGLPGAADDLSNLLSNSGFGPIQILPATRGMEQTMLVPTGELQAGGWEILQQLTGIDGFDTWTPDLIDGDLPMGAGVVVVIGHDYWGVPGMPTTIALSPTTTTTTP